MQSIFNVLKALRPPSASASPLSRAYGSFVKSLSRGNPIVGSCSAADVSLSDRPKVMPKKYAETASWLNSPPLALKENLPSTASRNSFDSERSSKPMGFVREVLEQAGGSHLSHHNNADQNADIVHIKLTRNNTFVNVTDYKGNKFGGIAREEFKNQYVEYKHKKRPKNVPKEPEATSGTSGKVPELRKKSRYRAEATAEHYGRLAREKGLLKSHVVVRVRGFTYFKKKRQAIMSFRDGFTGSRSDWNGIVSIEDRTRRPHNGCRLPKRRRI